MEVDWAEQQPDQLYKAGVKTYAHNVVGVLRQITSALAQQHVNIEDIHTSGDTYIKETKWVLWVHNLDQVDKVMRQLNHIPDITKVERITEGINT
jgi:(p)ppGpp synthase/HD superfamily hydrolase